MSAETITPSRVPQDASRISGGSVSLPGAPAPASALESVVCRHCQQGNPAARKFCGHCGKLLWEPCPKCGVEGPATERFCGACGTNIVAAFEERAASFDAELARAQDFRAAADYEKALDILNKVVRTNPLRLEARIADARRLAAEFTAERDRRLAEAETLLAKAKELEAAHAYETAVSLLEEVPDRLRSEEYQTFHEQVKTLWKEVLSLGGEIRQLLEEKRTLELLPKLDRLIQLQPAHAQARQLAEQLRDRYLQAAKKRLAGHQYREGLELLREIPSFLRTPEIENLQVRAAELEWLLTDLISSPVVDKPLLEVAERLLKFAPQNERAKNLKQQLEERAKTKPKDPRIPLPLWAAPPEKTRFGLAVDWLGGLERLAVDAKALPELAQHPGALFVAAGLALQGLELAQVATNLVPKEKTSALGSLGLFAAKKKPVKAAWGIDLTEGSLKAIKLACKEPGGKPALEECVVLEHSRSLAQVDNEPERASILAATLAEFAQKHDLANSKIGVSLPAARLLGRFITLPPLAKKQVPGVVEYEAKHQIPFPLSELIWDYSLLGEEETFREDHSHNVLLIAAKEFHVRDRLALFKSADINVDVMQSDAVALHNLIAHEFFGERVERPLPRTALAILDLGSDSTNLVVSSRQGVWFRSIRLGGDDFTKALVRQFKLSYSQAEALKRDPAKARRLSQFYEALEPVFSDLIREVERSLAAYANERTGLTLERLLAVGGGVRLHGVLRRLRTG